MPLYTPDSLATARAAAREHFGTDPVGRRVTGACPCCQEPIDGLGIDAYPACLPGARLPFDLAVQTAIGTMLLVGDNATLHPGRAGTVRRVEPVAVADLRHGDVILHGHHHNPANSPLAHHTGGPDWGTVVYHHHAGATIRVAVRDRHWHWRHHTYPDPTTLALRIAEVTAR